MPNFLDYIRENSTLDLSGDVDKNLSVGDVHVPAAGGDGGKKKKKKPEPPVSVAYNAKSFNDRIFGEDNTGNAAVDYFNSEMAKLKLKQKVSVECDPDELKALLSSHPEIAALFSRMIGKAYDPNEARDDHGRWTSGGGGESKLPTFSSNRKTVSGGQITYQADRQAQDWLTEHGAVPRTATVTTDIRLPNGDILHDRKLTAHVYDLPSGRTVEIRSTQGSSNPAAPSSYTVSIVDAHRRYGKIGKASATRQVLLMRHGATHLNDNDTSVDRIRGWKNVPLTEEGKEEAAKLAEKIAKDPPEHLVSSDLKRAADTAKMVAAACDLKMSKGDFREGLRPWDVGKFAGQPSKKAVPVLCDYAVNRPDETVPEGESFNEFYQRFTSELAKALKDYPDGVLGVVSHHRNERVLKASEKAGWKPGEIDGKEFSKKGEGTAGFELIDIPQAWLDGVASGKVTKWVGEDFDISKVFEDNQPARQVDKSFELTVCKVDTEQQIFYGWAYVSEENGQIVIDKQDDYILPGDLLKAAEDFTLHGGKLGDMHAERNVGRVVASFCTTEELCKAFGLAVQDNRRGWILGFKVDDPQVWAKIKNGDQIELSIGGRGERVEWETADGQPHVRAQ